MENNKKVINPPVVVGNGGNTNDIPKVVSPISEPMVEINSDIIQSTLDASMETSVFGFDNKYNETLALINNDRKTKKVTWLPYALSQLGEAYTADLEIQKAYYLRENALIESLKELTSVRELSKLITFQEQRIVQLKGYFDNLNKDLSEYHNKNVSVMKNQYEQDLKTLNDLKEDIQGLHNEKALQAVSFYEYYHPAENSITLSKKLAMNKAQQQELITSKKAISAVDNFRFNDSLAEGKKFVKSFCDLMLSAYNSTSENLTVKAEKGRNLESALKKMDQEFNKIEKLGTMIQCKINTRYHSLRKEEIEISFQYKDILAQEAEERKLRAAEMRESERAERATRKAIEAIEAKEKALIREQREVERNRERERIAAEQELEQARVSGLVKEYERLLLVVARLKEDDSKMTDLKVRLADLKEEKKKNGTMLANNRAGYVYVISNVGSFGKGIVKIGLTRRVNPEDRVDELGDASVPFRFETHVLHYSDDAVGLEKALHKEFANQAVNKVNYRKEFFRVSPQEVMNSLTRLTDGGLLKFDLEPISPEYAETCLIEQRLN